MEATSLSHAHAHARNASLETRKANHLAASEEHDLAAAEFATAAKDTTDSEALRTLKLLEQHHARLAELLKDRPQGAILSSADAAGDAPTAAAKSLSERPTPSTPLETTIAPPSTPPTPPKLPQRELGSSIASNLASARGIPSNRQRNPASSPAKLTPQNAEGRLSNPTAGLSRQNAEVERRRKAREAAKEATAAAANSRPSSYDQTPSQEPPSAPIPPPVTLQNTEDAFSRFYNTFSPWISKLSAPLAFAGLPLIPDAPPDPSAAPQGTPTQQTSPSASTSTVKPSKAAPHAKTSKPPSISPTKASKSPPTTSTPDLTTLISAPARRALQSSSASSATPYGNPQPSESFYVVPTTGGTISYAGVLARLPQTTSNLSEIAEDDAQEFVDAPSSPTQARTRSSTTGTTTERRGGGGGGGGEKRVGNKTMEELHMENIVLRRIADDFSRRLQAFEMGAMRGSMALHASLRAMQSNSPAASVGGMAPLRRAGTDASEGGGGGGVDGKAGGGGGGGPDGKAGGGGGGGDGTKADERAERLEAEAKELHKEVAHLKRENEKYRAVVARYREKWEKLKDGARERMGGKREGE